MVRERGKRGNVHVEGLRGREMIVEGAGENGYERERWGSLWKVRWGDSAGAAL